LKRKTTLNIVIIVSFLILQSCASFQKNAINPKLLTEKNITELNGKYNIIDIEADSIRKKNWASNNFFTELESKIFFKPTKLDTLKTYQFELKVLSKKRIQINYLENDKIFKERIVKGKLKKDGYFYLKNKNVKLWGVPYLAGAIHINKTRISKTKKGNLIFDLTHHQSGAFFFFVFPGGANWEYRNTYQKTE